METIERFSNSVAAALIGAPQALSDFLSEDFAPAASAAFVELLLEKLFLEIHALRGEIATLKVENKAIAARVTGIEEGARFKDCGVWNGLTPYLVGDHVTDHGSFWSCRVAHVSQRPGSESTKAYWRMVSKKGEPGIGDPR